MTSPFASLPLGTGFLHREIVEPLTREPIPCVLAQRYEDVCFVRPLVLVAPWWERPHTVFHQACGHGEYWSAWRLNNERLRRGLIELRDVRENTFTADAIPLPARVPCPALEPRRGLRFLHRALLLPYSWRPLPGRITQVRGGRVGFVGLAEIAGHEHVLAPYGGRERSGRWQMPEDAFHQGLIAPIE